MSTISGYECFVPKESHYVQIGITIRFGNRMWKEVSGTILAGSGTGDNMPTVVMRGVRKKKKKEVETMKQKPLLLFPTDFAGTLSARDGIKTGPGTPNGEDAYDRKLVVVRYPTLKG